MIALGLRAGPHRHAATDRRWLVTREEVAGGRSVKVMARELGGTGFLSLNLYRTAAGWRFFPCETSVADAEALIAALLPESPGASDAEDSDGDSS